MTHFITASIPYVNAAPHLGYAYELVQADIAARARRQLDTAVRFTSGTDDNSLKNVLAAHRAGEPVADFVDRHAAEFVRLHRVLDLAIDDVVHTSHDERHRAAVERIWRAAETNGDLYRRDYRGQYCVGCEQFRQSEDLLDGRCPEHGTVPEVVEENNWFFRLSRYQDHVHQLLTDDIVAVRPTQFRREALAFVEGGLDDISVSRSAARAYGWGIPVPGDADQVIYVWFDALTNYLSTLDWADPQHRGTWAQLSNRTHVIGKGILRFHAVFWPAFLEAAGEPPPTDIRVHPYLTVDGHKISKSTGSSIDPIDLAERIGADPVRWYFARDIAETADTDVSTDRIVARANDELANGIGNAVNRITTLIHRTLDGHSPPAPADDIIERACNEAVPAFADFEHRTGARKISDAIKRLNAEINRTEPWIIAKDPSRRSELSETLATHAAGARAIGTALQAPCPSLAAKIIHQLDPDATTTPRPTFERITEP